MYNDNVFIILREVRTPGNPLATLLRKEMKSHHKHSGKNWTISRDPLNIKRIEISNATNSVGSD